jgi:hypothetical protein
MRSMLVRAIAFGAAALGAACGDGGGGADAGTDAGDGGADAGADPAFADANLEQCVRAALGLPEGELAAEALASLTHLECRDMGITALDGMQRLTGLVTLTLWENEIADAAPLAGLAGLEQLELGNNLIADVSWAAGLAALTRLGLSVNAVSDLSPLAGLTGLEWLNLDANAITDASPLAGLSALSWLTIERNGLGSDVDVLDELAAGGCEVYALYQEMLSVHGPTDGGAGRSPAAMISSRAPLAAMAAPAGAGAAAASRPPTGGGATAFDETPDWAAQNTELLDVVLASPNQYDAGSCLFMATTGAAEILLGQHVPIEQVQYLGDTDLSERFLMNASDYVPAVETQWFFTDLVYAYNVLGGSMLDRDYPMATAVDGSYLTVYYSWTNDLPDDWEELLAPVPPIERTTIFADPAKSTSSQWNVALMDDRHVERIKYELRTRKAPVIVVYNHYLYWHANMIVGYDDTVDTDGCPMVESSLDYFEDEGATGYVTKIEDHMAELGGCTSQGVFYVRDSIYEGDADEPTYHYGGPYPYDAPYSERIVELDYNWIKYLANHVYVVHRS